MYECNSEAEVINDQVLDDEMEIQPVTDHLSDTEDINNKASQDNEDTIKPCEDEEEDWDEKMSVDSEKSRC